MTELQLGLLAIGALAVVGVMAYNAVQERRVRRRLSRQSDIGTRSDSDPMPTGTASGAPRAPGLGERRTVQDAAGDGYHLPDDTLDYVIGIEASAGKKISAKTLFARMPSIQRRFANGVRIAVADAHGAWHGLAGQAGGFSRMQIGLQLVTRAGIVSEADLIEFRSEIENFAVELGANVTAGELRRAMDHARVLARLCEDADVQIALHVNAVTGTGFDAKLVAETAAAAGLTAAEGRYQSCDSHGQVQFALEQVEHAMDGMSAGLTLLLDVPRVGNARRAYESMVDVARRLSEALDGVIADENGVPLDEPALAAIGAEVERIVAALDGHGIATGSALARRLLA